MTSPLSWDPRRLSEFEEMEASRFIAWIGRVTRAIGHDGRTDWAERAFIREADFAERAEDVFGPLAISFFEGRATCEWRRAVSLIGRCNWARDIGWHDAAAVYELEFLSLFYDLSRDLFRMSWRVL